MRVLQIIDKLNVGGAERVSVDISILLKKENVDVEFLCLLDASVLDQELKNHNIKVQYLLRKNKYNPITLFKLSKILNTYTIVHVHSRHVLRYVCLAQILFKSRNYSIVFHDHYGNIETDKTISKYLKLCIKRCSAYLGVSSSLTDWAEANYLNSNIHLLENTITREENLVKNDTSSQIVVIGNLRPQKNYEFLLKLLKELPEHISVDVYGKVVDESYYNKLKMLSRTLKVNHRIHFISNCNNTQSILANYKMGFHCASSETGPIVAIEYMAQGLPFIMFNTGQVAKDLSGELKSLLVENFNLLSWKHSLLNILNDSDLRLKLSEQLKTHYQKNYSTKTYISKCLKIYKNLKHY